MPMRRRSPPRTQEAEDNELIGMATNLAREQLLNKTASAQVITHYLKLGAARERERLELEKIRRENELLKAKTEAYAQEKNFEKTYLEAIEAMRAYSGSTSSYSERDVVIRSEE